MVYVTRGLVETLLGMAQEAEPDGVTISLAVTRAEELPEADLDPETPVFTDFYLPSAGSSVNAVFGMDLGTPAGQTQGRFVSHPDGYMGVSKLDDLHEVIFVAIPPWDDESFGAFDRSGRTVDVEILDIEPPEESLA
ncbi:hypothetical protein [Haloarcula sediminis]|uniref:hypothetical protein n=1 Tax=Haloarcula sediminis TaxID=3111777 RepID=UPI002D7726CC|nr:hypothetical protein [Haloarcula sp. CK38]